MVEEALQGPRPNLERLRQVVRVLHQVSDENRLFNIQYWGVEEVSQWFNKDEYPEGSCGTAACAIGWVGLDPWFRRRGFCSKLTRMISSEDVAMQSYFPCYTVRNSRYTSWNAVQVFFQISIDDAAYLFEGAFYPEDRRTARDVAERVESFIAKYEPKKKKEKM